MHYSVMLKEVIDNLNLKDTGIYVDATLGYAGHTGEILKRVKNFILSMKSLCTHLLEMPSKTQFIIFYFD